MERPLALATLLFSLSFFVACGGGGVGAPAVPPAGTMSEPLSIRMTIPQLSGSQRSSRAPLFVSPSTNGAQVQVFAAGDTAHANQLAQAAVDLSSASKACSSSGSTRTCTVTIQVPVGNDAFVVTTYDTSPVNGAFASTAHVLGIGGLTQMISGPPAAPLQIFISGQVANVGVPALLTAPATGTPQQIAIVVKPTDFDNNPITAGKNDPFANPISVTLAEYCGCGDAQLVLNGTPIAAGASALLKQSSDTLAIQYSGGGAPGYSATLSFSATGASAQSLLFSPLIVTGFAPYFVPTLGLALLGLPSATTLNIGEAGTTGSGTAYAVAAAPTTCNGPVLSLGSITGTQVSATLPVGGGGTASASGCSITVTDPSGVALSIPVTNTVTGGPINLPGSQILTFPLPGFLPSPSPSSSPLPPSDNGPTGITLGSDGNLWFTDFVSDQIDSIGTNGVLASPFGILSSISGFGIASRGADLRSTPPRKPFGSYHPPIGPTGIALGSDGRLWFTEELAGAIGRISVTGQQNALLIPASYPHPNGITLGSDGALWFTESGAIGRITTLGGLTQYPITGASPAPDQIASGPDGNLWFTDLGNNAIGRITTGGAVTEFPLSAGAGPSGITAGSDGKLWFTEESANKIGTITTSGGGLIEYPLPTANASPHGIASGPDGALYFTEVAAGKLGRITTAGAITEYPIPGTGVQPVGIVAAPDGALWFTAGTTSPGTYGLIGRLQP